MKLPWLSKKKKPQFSQSPQCRGWVYAAVTQTARVLIKENILPKLLFSSYPAKFDVSVDCYRLPHLDPAPGKLVPRSCPWVSQLEQPARATLSC